MALILPEIKHEYLFHLDTEETKNSVFDQCRAEGKEAAYSTFGTAQNDSEYQPAPTVEPDYYMQYCSSDGYDYLKDYRLVWGYGIGIIEQDVICSLTTGEHLAEGKEACDTYETENAAGKDVDWKRGIWLKFSGNRNNSPARIGEVVLPDYIISLKDLCATLQIEDECNFDWFIGGTNILNLSNVCGQKNITVNIGADKIISSNVKDMSYAFANTTIGQDTDMYDFMSNPSDNSVDLNHCFYNAKVTKNVGKGIKTTSKEDVNITSMYENCTFYPTDQPTYLSNQYVGNSTFKNSKNLNLSFGFFDCQTNVVSCFEGCSINYTGRRTGSTDDDIVWAEIDFGLVNRAKRMFYNTSWVEDEVFLDLSSVVEHEDGCFDDFSSFEINKIINIKAPDVKLKGYCAFKFSYCSCNIIGNLQCYDLWDEATTCKLYNGSANNRSYCFIYGSNNIIKGIITGINIFECYILYPILIDGSNVVIKTSKRPDDLDIKDVFEKYKDTFFPSIFLKYSSSTITINNIMNYINVDDYYPVNSIIVLNCGYDININNDIEFIVDKKDKEFCIITRRLQGIYGTIECNKNSICTIYSDNYNVNNDYIINNPHLVHYDYIKINNIDIENKLPILIYSAGVELNNKTSYDCYGFYNIRLLVTDDTKLVNFYFDVIDELYISDLSRKSNYYDYINIHIVGNRINKLINNYSYSSSYQNNPNLLHNSLINIYLKEINIIETELENVIPFCNIYRRFENDELLDYPTITNAENYDYIGIVGEFKNTPLSILNKRFYRYFNNNYYRSISLYRTEEYINDIENFNFNYDYVLYDFSIYGDYTNKTVTFNTPSNGSTIGGTISNNSNKIYNLTTELHGANCDYNNISGNLNINLLNEYNKGVSIRNNCNIDTLTLNLNNNGFANGFGLSFYSYDNSITINDIFINTTGGRINIDIDYSLFSTLSEESINSIVNPAIYKSGITITINTIPFQYITEEQKQALVNAGVTLVEYIPQTE